MVGAEVEVFDLDRWKEIVFYLMVLVNFCNKDFLKYQIYLESMFALLVV
jgi:hypothetical protein